MRRLGVEGVLRRLKRLRVLNVAWRMGIHKARQISGTRAVLTVESSVRTFKKVVGRLLLVHLRLGLLLHVRLCHRKRLSCNEHITLLLQGEVDA